MSSETVLSRRPLNATLLLAKVTAFGRFFVVLREFVRYFIAQPVRKCTVIPSQVVLQAKEMVLNPLTDHG